MIGRRFGRLLVIERVPSPDRFAMWRCICDCGATIITAAHTFAAVIAVHAGAVASDVRKPVRPQPSTWWVG